MQYSVLIYILFVLSSACSDDNNDEQSTFKTQTDALAKANEVEDKIEAAAKLQRQAIEDSTQ